MINDKEIKRVRDKIWNSMDHLRDMGLQSNSYDILLFLLVLKRKNLLPAFNFKPSEKLFVDTEMAVKQSNNFEFEECFKERYKILMRNLGEHTFNMILSHVHAIDLNISDLSFQKVFENILYTFTNAQGRYGGETLLPEGLAIFMINQVNLTSGSKVYNPFAGHGTFGIHLDDGISYLGEEIKREIWALGVLRRVVHGKNNGTLIQGDSITEWVDHSEFDLIITAPPFGNIKSFSDTWDTRYKSCDQYVVKRGIDSLKSNGKLVVLVAESFLFNTGAYIPIRKRLVEEDLIETIISLPAGILPNSGVKSSILILNKNKQERGTITLVDGSYFEVKVIKSISINYEEVIAALSKGAEADGVIKITNEEVISQDLNLEVSRYFWKEEMQKSEDKDAQVQLSDILSDVKGQPIPEQSEIRLVSIKHLTKDTLDYKLNIDEADYFNGGIKNSRLINDSCLMLAKVGNDLKPTYFDYQEEKLAVSNNVMTFQVREDKVDLDYLVNELYSEFIVKQLEVYRRGVAQKSISKADFLQINIPLPSLQEQKDRMKGVKEAFIKSRLHQIELQKELLGFKDEAFREFASIKHTFRQYLNALKSNVSGTRKFFARNDGKPIGLDTLFSKNLNRTLGEHLLSLEGTVDSMSRLISEEKLDQGAPEILGPKELIEEAQNRFKNPDIFKFEEVFVDHSVFVSEEGYLNPYIKITKEGFFRIFANIVYNAVEHGFKNKTRNVIRTSISFDEENRFVLLEISNNGKPIPEAFTQKHLTTRGEKTTNSSGTGAGGADIKGLLEKYNARLELKKDRKAKFPVAYVLKFPLFTMIDKFDLGDFNLDDFNLDDLNLDI